MSFFFTFHFSSNLLFLYLTKEFYNSQKKLKRNCLFITDRKDQRFSRPLVYAGKS